MRGYEMLCAGYENEMKFAVHRQGMKKLCTVREKNQSVPRFGLPDENVKTRF
jgi:hypothetical protein